MVKIVKTYKLAQVSQDNKNLSKPVKFLQHSSNFDKIKDDFSKITEISIKIFIFYKITQNI